MKKEESEMVKDEQAKAEADGVARLLRARQAVRDLFGDKWAADPQSVFRVDHNLALAGGDEDDEREFLADLKKSRDHAARVFETASPTPEMALGVLGTFVPDTTLDDVLDAIEELSPPARGRGRS